MSAIKRSEQLPLVVITMAGLGSRFRAAGYTVPKYQIGVRGRTLFAWSMESLRSFVDAGCPFVFVALRQDQASAFLATEADALGIDDHRLVELSGLTDGQATTAMLALDKQDERRPLVIYNIDTYVEPAGFPLAGLHDDGWIPCFPGQGDAWSFVRASADGRVLEVREKRRISPHATLGLYGFGSVGLFCSAYDEYYADPANLESGERYIAPLYNQLVTRGGTLWMTTVEPALVHPLGTPAEVDAFARSGGS